MLDSKIACLIDMILLVSANHFFSVEFAFDCWKQHKV